jgi:Kdo2-lipid IVA lauroyltransferase/acyltransferase
MAEPLRRRLRARAIERLSGAAGGWADPFVRSSLRGAAELLRWSRYQRVALANLELALPELPRERRRAIAAGVRRHTARIVHEWLFLARAARSERERERIAAWVDRTVALDDSVARLEALARGGRGLIIVTAHLGNWELLAAKLRQRGLDGAVVGLHRRNDPSSDWLVGMRAALGVTTLAQDESPRRALDVLAGGATLGLLCDLEVPRLAGEAVPFFGRPALTMTAPAALARAARLPLVPVRCVARGAGYVLSVGEPLELGAGERRAAAHELLARMNATFEGWIRADPEQWAWHQPRWRASPESDERAKELRKPLAARRRR